MEEEKDFLQHRGTSPAEDFFEDGSLFVREYFEVGIVGPNLHRILPYAFRVILAQCQFYRSALMTTYKYHKKG